ncbi:alpha/beta-hydrolase family protein [Ornithinimicrobium cavernae]|uniref:alpha/beta-hydrolase family protein n=1 Tax=Ornithinimicrobium cavernae TaxID=2666047 RepID=UPI000D68FAD9|nr:alpha/beta-hydrolase family protein [Ornithinimicrobium cavernae]
MLTRTPLLTAGPGRDRAALAAAGRLRDRLPAPPVGATLTVGSALVLSTIPSLLPRPALTQGLLTGSLVLLALAVLALTRVIVTRRARVVSPGSARARWTVAAGTASAVAGTAWSAQLGLGQHAAGLAMAVPGPTYWLTAGGWALLVVGLGLTAAAGARRLGGITWRRSPLPLAAALLAGVTVTSAAAGPADVLAPLRKDLAADHVMLTESPLGASRSFARAGESPTPEAGAELAVDRLVAEGGLRRSAIVIALPTGSGWVNGEAVSAFEAQLDGDVAVVSAQYGDLPSWWSYLVDQEPALRSAEALLDEVVERVGQLPPPDRPDVYVFGESLGALAGQAAIAGATASSVCGVVWSGAPGGAVSGHPRERSLHNVDDPVYYLAADTALRQPDDWPTTWLPGLSYGTTVLDLAVSLAPDDGHGHTYGPEQDWTLPAC